MQQKKSGTSVSFSIFYLVYLEMAAKSNLKLFLDLFTNSRRT